LDEASVMRIEVAEYLVQRTNRNIRGVMWAASHGC
jgi:hypothetical protein